MVNFVQFKKAVGKLGLGEEWTDDRLRAMHRDFLRTHEGWGLDEDVMNEVSKRMDPTSRARRSIAASHLPTATDLTLPVCSCQQIARGDAADGAEPEPTTDPREWIKRPASQGGMRAKADEADAKAA